MAYITDITRQCNAHGCASRASKALRNRYNEDIGYYCAKCAPRALRDFQKNES